MFRFMVMSYLYRLIRPAQIVLVVHHSWTADINRLFVKAGVFYYLFQQS